MGKRFERCVYCFGETDGSGPCPHCGYDHGLCDPPAWWLSPGTVLKGRYVAGKNLSSSPTELGYLGWDLERNSPVRIVEYFPKGLVTRDITASERISCIPGGERLLKQGQQRFLEKAKLFYQCVRRVQPLDMEFFFRNDTCYYVRSL
ncbi:MAG: hypothetical protein E7466_04260 [Ruminococcaceae bacterium]|nr:hypothetical protein [Oscillospiraceae bacterium]